MPGFVPDVAFVVSQVEQAIADSGVECLFGSARVRAATEPRPATDAGLGWLGHFGLTTYEHHADPRRFTFAASEFAPSTAVPVPQVDTTFIYQDLGFRVNRVFPEVLIDSVVSYIVSAHRVLITADGSLSPVFDIETVQMWRPQTLASATDPMTLAVRDPGFVHQEDRKVFFAPLRPEEKMATFGQIDVRVDRLISIETVKIGDAFWRPGLAETWIAVTASDPVPGAGFNATIVRHMAVSPRSIRTP